MPRTRWIRNNSYKYKLQIVLVLLIFFVLSGCGLIINNMLENTEKTESIEFQIIYQGFYYQGYDSTRIFGDEFSFNDLISVRIDSTSNVLYNGEHYYFLNNENNDIPIIYSRNENFFENDITPPGLNIITKQST
ncbi:MAG: hypothetical protein H0Z22_05950, partial [Thermosipho sp. (in: Bacteria)]|nr:hypothetical protein [Thermosipho sp. (in: thermotogales)]